MFVMHPGQAIERQGLADGHYTFMGTPSMPIPSPDGDVGADAAGFERAPFLKQLAAELNQFFDRTLQ